MFSKSVPEARSPQVQVQEVACNHLVYFTDKAGLRALVQVIAQNFANLPESVTSSSVSEHQELSCVAAYLLRLGRFNPP